MNKFLTLTETQRRTVFEQTAARVKLPLVAIEKDFWVTELLFFKIAAHNSRVNCEGMIIF